MNEDDALMYLVQYVRAAFEDGDGDCAGEPDEDSIGWMGDGSPMTLTFGHVRRAKAALVEFDYIAKET